MSPGTTNHHVHLNYTSSFMYFYMYGWTDFNELCGTPDSLASQKGPVGGTAVSV